MPEHVTWMQIVWPTLLSGVLVFIASSLVHMVFPWHKTDYPGVPDEEAFRKAVGALKLPPGDYFVPRPGGASMKDPAFIAKLNEGPRVVMTILPNGVTGMGGLLGKWFVYCLVVNLVAAHVATGSLDRGASYLRVFHTVGLAAFAGYVLALWQAQIWFSKSTSTTIKSSVDGLIYALLTAGTFGWLWPR